MFRARMFRLWTSEMFRSYGRRSVFKTLRRSDSNLKKLTANYAGGNRRQIILWLVDSLSLRGNEWTCINLCAFINFSPPFAKTIRWIFISHWRGWLCVKQMCQADSVSAGDVRPAPIEYRTVVSNASKSDAVCNILTEQIAHQAKVFSRRISKEKPFYLRNPHSRRLFKNA